MPFLSTDSKQGGNFDPITPGEYEVVISEVQVTTSSSQNPMIKAVLVIRSDVDQEFANRKIFDNLAVTEAAMFKFHNLSSALGFEDGHEFDTLEEFAQSILYSTVRVKTKQEEYNGNVNAKVVTYKPSEEGAASPESVVNASTYGGRSSRTASDPFADDGKPIDISDDDLPF
jgi:hypothetical protein